MKAGVRAALARAEAPYCEPIRVEAIHGDTSMFTHVYKKNQSAVLIGIRYEVHKVCVSLLSDSAVRRRSGPLADGSRRIPSGAGT